MSNELAQILPIIAGVVAGAGWSTVGIWSKWRSGLDASVDWIKLRKNLLIGLGTGIVTWGYSVSQGNVPLVTDLTTFIVAVVGYFSTVVIVDKILTKQEETKPVTP